MAEEKTFKHYEEFPPEIRMEVVNEMQPIERVRFTRCSKLSQNEAKKSKNYVYQMELKLSDSPPQNLKISMFHVKSSTDRERRGYEMVFVEEGEQKYTIYKYPDGRELCRSALDESVDLAEYAKEHFKSLLRMYQNTVKVLFLHGTNHFDYGIRSLKSVEQLRSEQDSDILQFAPIIRKPLKMLSFGETESIEAVANFNLIYEVKFYLDAYCLTLNYQQFIRLNARMIHISIEGLTENDIYRFIRSWQNGTIRGTFKLCCWNMENSQFDTDRLVRLLDVQQINDEDEDDIQVFGIKHDTQNGVFATLQQTFSSRSLEFVVPSTGNNRFMP